MSINTPEMHHRGASRSAQGAGLCGLSTFKTLSPETQGVEDPVVAIRAYDAVAEDWFDDLAAMCAAFTSRGGKAVIADGRHLPGYDPVAGLGH
jgi:EthD domain